jgi:dTMP kinase
MKNSNSLRKLKRGNNHHEHQQHHLHQQQQHQQQQYQQHIKQACKGKFIVLEGLDRTGKTTQVEFLINKLQLLGKQCKLQRFPDRSTEIGKTISSYLENKSELEDHAIHLLFTANRWEIVPNLLNSLENGIHVICDRYSYSGIAYSAAKPTLNLNWCKSVEADLPIPDRIIYLVSNEVDDLTERGDFGQERYEKLEFQKEVEKNYEKLFEKDKNLNGIYCKVNCNGSINEVSERVWSAVLDLF